MYAVIHCVITEVMTHIDESSKFIDVNCKFHRCGRPSCLGSACKLCLHEDFYRVAIVSQKQKPIGFCHHSYHDSIVSLLSRRQKVCSVLAKKVCSVRIKKSAPSSSKEVCSVLKMYSVLVKSLLSRRDWADFCQCRHFKTSSKSM